jgi:BNR/Asp-box repeat
VWLPLCAMAALLGAVALAPNPAGGARSYGPGDTGVVNVTRTPALAEAEEPLSVNPLNPNDVLVVANRFQPTFPPPLDDVPAGSGINFTVVYSTRDGGRTWTGGRVDQGGLGTVQNPLAAVPGTPSQFDDFLNVGTTDADAAWDRHGNAYFQSGSIHGLNQGGNEVSTVFRSVDAGRTWPYKSTAVNATEERNELDRPWLAVDNTGGRRDGTVYITTETTPFLEIPPEVYVKVSTDRGKTWGPTYRVDDGLYETQFNPRAKPVVGGGGVLYVVYDQAPITMTPWTNLGTIKLVVAASSDGGKTFRRLIVDDNVHRAASPDEAMPSYTEMISAIAADRFRAGRVAVAWPEAIDANTSRIVMRYTTDGGRTWSRRIDVADDRIGAAPNQHDHVALTWTQDGRLVASWRDRRCCGGTWDSRYQLFARIFSPRGRTLTGGRTIELTEGRQPVNAGTHGLLTPDEFQGLGSSGGYLMASWAQLVGDYTDVFFRRVPLSAFGR